MYTGQQEKAKQACGFCGRSLSSGFYYVCHVCGSTYCYAHKPDHCDHRKATAPPMNVLAHKKT